MHQIPIPTARQSALQTENSTLIMPEKVSVPEYRSWRQGFKSGSSTLGWLPIWIRMQGFYDQKLGKIYSKKKCYFDQTTIYLSLRLHKWRPNYKRNLQLSKENIQHFNIQNLLLWFIFALLDPDPDFNYGSDPLAWLNPDPDGSGSETLVVGIRIWCADPKLDSEKKKFLDPVPYHLSPHYLQGGLLYIKPPMHVWFIRPLA
jgi:hypothetical protein